MNGNIIKKAFASAQPSEELVQKVLAIKDVASDPHYKKARRFSSRRIFATAAVCIVLACAVTAAAVTGIIDFDAIFGDYIAVKDSELADPLIGTVSRFKYKVSDGDYKIDVKGVTGTEREMIAVVEISRRDGEPVIGHFANPTDETHLLYLWQEDDTNLLFNGSSSGIDCYINDAGNIELYMEFGSGRKIDGKTVTVRGENFYPEQDYKNFKKGLCIDYLHQKDFSGYVKIDEISGDGPFIAAKVDDSPVLALALEWEFSFQYTASQEALRTKDSFGSDKGFPYYQDVYALVQNEDGSYRKDESTYTVQENSADSVQIKIGSLGGNIQFSYPLNEYEKACFGHPMAYSIDGRQRNEMLLIMEDGTKIPIKIKGESKSNDSGPLYQCSCDLLYLDEQDRKRMIDIDSVAAISINGIEYSLK